MQPANYTDAPMSHFASLRMLAVTAILPALWNYRKYALLPVLEILVLITVTALSMQS